MDVRLKIVVWTVDARRMSYADDPKATPTGLVLKDLAAQRSILARDLGFDPGPFDFRRVRRSKAAGGLEWLFLSRNTSPGVPRFHAHTPTSAAPLPPPLPPASPLPS